MAERALATAFVNLVPGTKDIDTYLKNKLGDDAGVAGDDAGKKMGTGMGNSFMTTFKNIAGVAGLTLGVASIVDFFKDSGKSLMEEQAGQAQTKAAIESTGGAAKVTAGHVDELANSLEAKTATDADAIRSGENLLLTFTNIKNGVGDGNDIFDQATVAATDMARAMGTDVNTAAMQLGKALQDPVAGVAALQRVGVRLSDDQKKQVADFMKVGDAASAQKVILGELSKEFGGSGAAYADTYAGKMFAVSDAFDDMGKKVVAGAMPALMAIADILGNVVAPALGAVFGFISDNFATIATFVGVLGAFAAVMGIMAFVTNAEAMAQLALNFAFLANPITWVALGVAALVAGIVWLATKTTFFQDVWKVMSDFVMGAITAVTDFFTTGWQATSDFFSDLWNGIVTFLGGIWDSIKGGFDVAWQAIQTIFSVAFEAITQLFLNWTLLGLIVSHWTDIQTFFSDTFANIGKFFSDLWDGAKKTWDIFKSWIETAVGKTGDAIKGIFQGISDFVARIFGGLVGMLKTPLNTIIGMANRVISALNGIHISIPDWVPGIGGNTFGISLASIPALADGGFVTGPTTALIGEAGPEVVTPLKDFERMMGLDGNNRGQTINYYAAPNVSLDAEAQLVSAVQRAGVLAW